MTPPEPGTWVKRPGFVLEGGGVSGEGDSVQEPMVFADGSGYRMLYTRGFGTLTIGTATSSDGITWTKGSNPVLGNGTVVAHPAGHTGMVINGTDLHLFFTDSSSGSTNLKRATSTDGGLSFGGVVTALTPTGWESGRWGNSACVIEGGTWHLIYESFNGSSIWEMGYATSPDGLTWTRQNSGNPLSTLRYGTGMYGGPDLHKVGSTWHLYYHASTSGLLPTRIYHATSTDLITWTKDPAAPIVEMTQAYEFDQVADPHVVDVDGDTRLYYVGLNNTTGKAYINYATLAV